MHHWQRALLLLDMQKTESLPPTRASNQSQAEEDGSMWKGVRSLATKLIDSANDEEPAPEVEGVDYKLGKLQYAIAYDFRTLTLTVTIFRACALPAKDFTGTSDPYVKVLLLPDKKHKLLTKVRKRNLNPHWNERFVFEDWPHHKLLEKTLYLQVIDYDRFSRDDPIGEITLPLNEVDLTQKKSTWRFLEPCKESRGKLGEVLLSLCYQPAVGRLIIEVKKAKELKAKDITGTSDKPEVKKKKHGLLEKVQRKRFKKDLRDQTTLEELRMITDKSEVKKKNHGLLEKLQRKRFKKDHRDKTTQLRMITDKPEVKKKNHGLLEKVQRKSFKKDPRDKITLEELRRITDKAEMKKKHGLQRKRFEKDRDQTTLEELRMITDKPEVKKKKHGLLERIQRRRFKRDQTTLEELRMITDPYVKMWLMHGNTRVEKRKTTIKRRTLNPTFDETFIFDISWEKIRESQIHVIVMDFDKLGRNELIGKLVLGSRSGPTEMKHWNDMVSKPRQSVSQWHILKD